LCCFKSFAYGDGVPAFSGNVCVEFLVVVGKRALKAATFVERLQMGDVAAIELLLF
jgi:hypothetical protein